MSEHTKLQGVDVAALCRAVEHNMYPQPFCLPIIGSSGEEGAGKDPRASHDRCLFWHFHLLHHRVVRCVLLCKDVDITNIFHRYLLRALNSRTGQQSSL